MRTHGPGLPLEAAVALVWGMRGMGAFLEDRRHAAFMEYNLARVLRNHRGIEDLQVLLVGCMKYDDRAAREGAEHGMCFGPHRWVDIVSQERAARIGTPVLLITDHGHGRYNEPAQLYRADGGRLVVAYRDRLRAPFLDTIFGPLSYMLTAEFGERCMNQRDLLRTILPLLLPHELVALDVGIERMAEAS